VALSTTIVFLPLSPEVVWLVEGKGRPMSCFHNNFRLPAGWKKYEQGNDWICGCHDRDLGQCPTRGFDSAPEKLTRVYSISKTKYCYFCLPVLMWTRELFGTTFKQVTYYGNQPDTRREGIFSKPIECQFISELTSWFVYFRLVTIELIRHNSTTVPNHLG
jgi:hypothetical protein